MSRSQFAGRFGLFAFGPALVLCLSGCGEPAPAMVPVTGKVKLKGEIPVSVGAIYFHPDAGNGFQDDVPSSLIDGDGQFKMKTFPYGEGVPPGKYRVTLASEIASRFNHPELADPAKTPWTIDVTDAGVSDHVFSVE